MEPLSEKMASGMAAMLPPQPTSRARLQYTLTNSESHGVTISAGSVLSKDVPDRCLVAGNPARVIASNYDNSDMIGLGESG